MFSNWNDRLEFDKDRIWHPYTSMTEPLPVYPVVKAEGVRLHLADGRELIDGMASWWCAIHGYRHPVLMEALHRQAELMPHVMFGGITHEPAIELAERLVRLTPDGLDCVFFADSGSVSIEAAIKMAIQYQKARGRPQKTRLLAPRGGYHGDTFAAMSVCDPVTGMHQIFDGVLSTQVFVPRPTPRFDEAWESHHETELTEAFALHADELAAVVLEPIVQGAGGMRFYSPDYLKAVRRLCYEHDVLLICDEIATGFGRTGRLFACEHANISPDIMTVGKAMTGGTMTLAAVLASRRVAEGISSDGGVFMHGPTFMGNPLACAVAVSSIDLLLDGPWMDRIHELETELREGLTPCQDSEHVSDVRVLGGIGVVETKHPVDVAAMQKAFVDRGVWIRPFANLVYLMPPYVISKTDLHKLTESICDVVTRDDVWRNSD